MSNLAQQFNDMDETHLAMSDPIELAKYIVELREENEQQFQNGFDAGREEYQVDQEFLDEKDEEIKKLKEKVSYFKSCDDRGELKAQIAELKRQLEHYKTCESCRKGLLEDFIPKLKEENEKLKKETKMWRLSGIVMREFTDPKGYYTNIEDYVAFDEFIKGHYPEEYEDLYEWFDIDSQLYEDEDEDEE